MKTLLEQHPNRRNKTTGKLTLINRPCPTTWMTTVTVLPPRMRSAEDFIMPEAPLEQECFKRQLIATARSLKKKQ